MNADDLTYDNRVLSPFDLECQYTMEDFLDMTRCGAITQWDGHGEWTTETHALGGVSCFSRRPEGATHVCWYNK